MISVVMATYNGEKFIEEQLQSIYDQTVQPDEVLIFDDRSTDGTVQKVKDFIARNELSDSWTITVNEENKGFFRNFLDGAYKSHGDTIYFSDQDDIWDLHKIEKLERCLKQPDVMMAQSDVISVDQNGIPLEKQSDYHEVEGEGVVEIPIFQMCRFAGLGCSMGLKKRVLEYIDVHGLYQEVFWAHDLLCALAAVSIGRVLYDKNVIDKHRLHQTNVTSKVDKRFTSGRTKNAQLDTLNRRTHFFSILSNACEDNVKSKVFERFSVFSRIRKEYIEHFSLKKFKCLFNHKAMYLSKYGLYSDTFYSIGLEKVVKKVLE